MNITNNPPQMFTGRAKIVRDADKICRKVNSAFPHISPSYAWINYNEPMDFGDAFLKIEKRLAKLRAEVDDTDVAYDYYNALMSLIRKYKCANCGELSDIAYLVCKNKNLKHVNLVGVYGYNPQKNKYTDYDHVAVSFRHGKDKIVIDPWFGFADFAKNCLLQYKEKYHKFFKRFNPDLKIVFQNEIPVRIAEPDLKDLMKIYPEL